MKKRYLISAYIFICLFVSSNSLIGQTKTENGKVLSKVIFVSGWDISSLTKLKPFEKKNFDIQNYSVLIQAYKLPKPLETTLEYHALDANGILVFDTMNVGYSGGISFSLNGKIFGYKVTYQPFTVSQRGEKVYGQGPLVKYYYCDEDGDGKFETRYVMNGDPKEVPNWVIEDKK